MNAKESEPKSGEAGFREAAGPQTKFAEGGKIKVSGRWYVIEGIDWSAVREGGIWDMWVDLEDTGAYVNEAFVEAYIPPTMSLEDRYTKVLELLDRHRHWCLDSEWQPGGRYHDSKLATETEKILFENN